MGGGGWQEVKFLKKGSLKSMMWNESLQTRRSPETGLRKSCDISKSCHRSSITLARLSRRKAEIAVFLSSASVSDVYRVFFFFFWGGGGVGKIHVAVLNSFNVSSKCWFLFIFFRFLVSFFLLPTCPPLPFPLVIGVLFPDSSSESVRPFTGGPSLECDQYKTLYESLTRFSKLLQKSKWSKIENKDYM